MIKCKKLSIMITVQKIMQITKNIYNEKMQEKELYDNSSHNNLRCLFIHIFFAIAIYMKYK